MRSLVTPPRRHALVVVAIAVTMASLFAISYSLALGRPTPHHVPAGIVGETAADADLVPALERATSQGLAFRAYGSLGALERAMAEQHVFAGLDLTGPRPRLLLASAAGVSVARVLEQAANRVNEHRQPVIAVVDLHPLPHSDPQGLVSFYMTLAATLLGFVTVFQLRANARDLRLGEWLAAIAGLAVVGGLVLALVAGNVIGALQGSFGEIWAVLSAEVAVAALFNAAMLVLIGRWAFIPTWGLLVVLGNASCGGAVAQPLLPSFYRFVGRVLPNGATVQILRSAAYFPSAQHLEPVLVLAIWLVGALALLLLSAHRLRRTPGW